MKLQLNVSMNRNANYAKMEHYDYYKYQSANQQNVSTSKLAFLILYSDKYELT